MTDNGEITTFDTGATRSKENTFDPEGFLSPVAVLAYCEYMAKHRVQKDGKLRDSDNWQKGIPTSRAMRGLWRHFLDMWLIHRGQKPKSADCIGMEDAVCGVLFNAMLILKNLKEGRDGGRATEAQ
jgi:hypothetical protein